MSNQTGNLNGLATRSTIQAFRNVTHESLAFFALNANAMNLVRHIRGLVVTLFFLCAAAHAECALLSLNTASPDIAVGLVQVSFDKDTGVFTVYGSPSSFHRDGVTPDASIVRANNTDPWFKITITVNSSGVATGGTFKLKGAVPTLGINNFQTLLKGNLAVTSPNGGFGHQLLNGVTSFNFRFSDDGTGALSSYYPSTIGVKIDPSTINFTGSFSKSFTNVGSGQWTATANVMAEVPEPTSLLSFSLLALMTANFGIRNRHKVNATQQ